MIIFYLRISVFSEVIYFVCHCLNYNLFQNWIWKTVLNSEVKFKDKPFVFHILQTKQNLVISRCRFTEQSKKNYPCRFGRRHNYFKILMTYWQLNSTPKCMYAGSALYMRHTKKKVNGNKSQIVFGQSDCFRTPFFRCIKQVACLFRLISNFDTSSLINKLKSRYFWLIKQEKLLIKQERWHFMFIKHVTFA